MRTLRAAFICGVLAVSLAIVVGAVAGIAPSWDQWIAAMLLGFGLAWTTVQIHSMPLKLVVAAVALVETAVLWWALHLSGIQWLPWTALAAGILATGFGVIFCLSKPGQRKPMGEAMFGGRISRATFEKWIESDEPFPLAGEKREASLVDCQLFNCREIAATLSAPDFVALSNQFSELAAQGLMDAGGVLIESNCEHARAVFGAPLTDPAHAAQANEAAAKLDESLKAFRQECLEQWSVEPDCRVSVQTGQMIIGTFGAAPLGGFGVIPAGE